MDIQKILVLVVFLLALAYVSRMIYRSLRGKGSCASNCKCGVDFSEVKVEKK